MTASGALREGPPLQVPAPRTPPRTGGTTGRRKLHTVRFTRPHKMLRGPLCADNSTWVKLTTIGPVNCQWFAENPPCTRWPDEGQFTQCLDTCGFCVPLPPPTPPAVPPLPPQAPSPPATPATSVHDVAGLMAAVEDPTVLFITLAGGLFMLSSGPDSGFGPTALTIHRPLTIQASPGTHAVLHANGSASNAKPRCTHRPWRSPDGAARAAPESIPLRQWGSSRGGALAS